jgi:hypothetical protein
VSVDSAAALEALQSDPNVLFVEGEGETTYHPQTAQSVPLIRADVAAAQGDDGRGCTVAVLDTGCDYTHADLGSCTLNAATGALEGPNCRVNYAADFAPQDNSRDNNGHGTNVASIVAKVAPGAKIMCLDIMGATSAANGDVVNAVNFVISNRDVYNICSINFSFGGTVGYVDPCPTNSIATALVNARGYGMLSAVASGNSAQTINGILQPACVPGLVSVGMVFDQDFGGVENCDTAPRADTVTCTSQTAYYLGMLAPGRWITAGGSTKQGTSQVGLRGALERPLSTLVSYLQTAEKQASYPHTLLTTATTTRYPHPRQASPHVAAAAAVLKSIAPTAPTSLLLRALRESGVNKTDAKATSYQTPRVDVAAATALVRTLMAAGNDTTPPTASVAHTSGAAFIKSYYNAQFNVTASDESGVVDMCYNLSSSCSKFVTFAPTFTYMLPQVEGFHTMYVRVRDAVGNIATAQTTVWLDMKQPITVWHEANGGATWTNSRTVEMTNYAYDEGGSGVGTMWYNTVRSFADEDALPYSNRTMWTIPGADDTVNIYFKVADVAGNPTTSGCAPLWWLPPGRRSSISLLASLWTRLTCNSPPSTKTGVSSPSALMSRPPRAVW